MIKLTAPKGQKIRDTFTGAVYSEVICSDKKQGRFVLADSDADPITVTELEGVSLKERVADLETAVEEIAVKSKVSIDLKAKATVKKEAAKK